MKYFTPSGYLLELLHYVTSNLHRLNIYISIYNFFIFSYKNVLRNFFSPLINALAPCQNARVGTKRIKTIKSNTMVYRFATNKKNNKKREKYFFQLQWNFKIKINYFYFTSASGAPWISAAREKLSLLPPLPSRCTCLKGKIEENVSQALSHSFFEASLIVNILYQFFSL